MHNLKNRDWNVYVQNNPLIFTNMLKECQFFKIQSLQIQTYSFYKGHIPLQNSGIRLLLVEVIS